MKKSIARAVAVISGLFDAVSLAERAARIGTVDMRLFLEFGMLLIFAVSAGILIRDWWTEYRRLRCDVKTLRENLDTAARAIRETNSDVRGLRSELGDLSGKTATNLNALRDEMKRQG